MTSNLVQLPSMIDPEARHIEFRAYECRECGAMGPIAQAANPVWMRWGDDHRDQTSHTKIYQWKLERSMGEVSTIGAPRAPRRRALGGGASRG